MNAKDFYDLNGKEKTEKIAIKAGTNWGYFIQIIKGSRRPSVELANKLVKASANQLDFVSLLTSKNAP
jgi:hypothetical protein